MIVLIGHGYIGRNIAKWLNLSDIPYTRITHKDSVASVLGAQFVINAAGYTGIPNVDSCEIHRDECMSGNVLFPLHLEKSFSGPILHISSGCVYTGYQKRYSEKDPPNFTFNNGSFYSGCKALVQKQLEPFMSKSYLFRIRMPFGAERDQKNLLTKLESYDRLIDKENSLTQIDDLARCVLFFIRNRPEFGIYNVTNPGSTTTRRIADCMGLEKKWMTDEEFASITRAPRSNCVLDTQKLESVFEMRRVEEALHQTVRDYK
jgi:dTDP-4-dehydrorhamnose reductase